MIDENPDSINDGAFSVTMDGSIWQAGPSTLHNGGCTFSFADGRAEMKQWTDRRSVNGRMATTYTSVFAYGQYQPNNLDIQWLQDRTTARQ
jgi:prepilin-type processing-associated H-X9-DG protein